MTDYKRGVQERKEIIGAGEGREGIAVHTLRNKLAFLGKYRAILAVKPANGVGDKREGLEALNWRRKCRKTVES